jgi:acetyl esterase
MSKIANDPRIDPRLKALFGAMPSQPMADAASREALLAEAATPEAQARAGALRQMLDAFDNEEIAPKAGLVARTETFVSEPDGNEVNIQFIRP